MLFVVTALAAMTLIAPGSGLAQGADNQYGIFFDMGATQVNINTVVNVPFHAYLILLQPVDEAMTTVTEINAFEVSVRLDNIASLFKLAAVVVPPNSINAGDVSDMLAGLKYKVGLANPYPVTDGKAVLIDFTFMKTDSAPVYIYLEDTDTGPIQYSVPTADPDVSYLVPAFTASGDQGTPVASFNGSAVAVESQTWGQLKSLYR